VRKKIGLEEKGKFCKEEVTGTYAREAGNCGPQSNILGVASPTAPLFPIF
jgi:hypothetical protein